MDLRRTVDRIQSIVSAETGRRLGIEAEDAVARLLRNAVNGSLLGEDGFTSRELTILFADVRGFTALAERHPPEVVLKVLNRCLIAMVEVVFAHEGTIDKFMGDSIMVLFGERPSGKDPVQRALACAVELQVAMDELNAYYRHNGLPELYLGIGLNTGPVFLGTLGSELFAARTVIGEQVNLASRIEAFSLRGQVLISESTFERAKGFVQTGQPFSVHVKGKTDPITVREVIEIPSLKRVVPRREIRKSPRVKVAIGFSYQVIHADITVPQTHRGVVLVLGYHGILAQVERPLPAAAELKIRLDLPLVNHRAADVYGRVKKTTHSHDRYLCGVEFTSLSNRTRSSIELLVQLLMQGVEPK
ncbi:MAG TPA: adenylate/guanylate cyclase domain-containing protein [Burkholderiales bacterium]|nr:adenylate/guanylate cyclase domain-containing protein [Burkholderiales bacterium]